MIVIESWLLNVLYSALTAGFIYYLYRLNEH